MVVEAMSLYADGALLRSVAVNFTVQGQRLGHRLTEAALRMAQARAIRPSSC